MTEQPLPKEYKGFSTSELLELWRDRNDIDSPPSKETFSAMWDLLKEYKLVDWDISPHITEQERIVRNKRLFAPFGVDPYPCADENGLEQPELWAAFLVEYDRKKKESWERGKARYEAECKATNQEWKLEAFPYADEDDPCWE